MLNVVAVHEATGVLPATLRFWEDEFLIKVQRSPIGQRLYDEGNVADFNKIRVLIQSGKSLPEAKRAFFKEQQEERKSFRDQLRVVEGNG